ncbi:hypothetical protein [Halovenus halobia]|uniref:hypothetical protein n=1 Tax=Halovenus halobia TaxID=3396622 RepID=UPI003F544154
MRRRHLLSVAGATLGASAGCLRRLTADRADGPPSVDAPTVELAPGEETMATVTARNVESMTINVFAVAVEDKRATRPGVAINDDHLTPTPTSAEDSMPPNWYWSPPRATVTYETPIRVPTDVSPNTYEYPVNISKDSDRASEPIRVRVTA